MEEQQSSEEQQPLADGFLEGPNTNASELPKDYQAAVERLSKQLDQTGIDATQQLAVVVTSSIVGLTLLVAQLLQWLGYPTWLEAIYKLLVLAEALIPLGLSFFIQRPSTMILVRLLGISVLIVYLFSLF